MAAASSFSIVKLFLFYVVGVFWKMTRDLSARMFSFSDVPGSFSGGKARL